MASHQSTPPVTYQQEISRIIFPYLENKPAVDKTEIKHFIEVFPEENIILFKGSSNEIFELKKVLTGGVMA